MGSLPKALLEALPPAAVGVAPSPEDAETALARVVAGAQAQHPMLGVSNVAFIAYLAARISPERSVLAGIEGLATGDAITADHDPETP